MAKISACVITKNEATNIARCLGSVKDSVDEIIVVDTGSTDETIAIAEKLGAKIFHHQWQNDFSAARNYALSQAKGDWIVFLDADEYIVADKAANLRPLLDKVHGNRKIEAISCAMEHTEGVGGRLKARDRTVRIFRNSPAIRYKGKIHEFIYKHDRFTQSAHAEEAAIVICHTGYATKKSAEKIVRNHLLLEESLRDGSADGMTYYYLGHSYWALQQYAQAVEFANKAIADGMVRDSMFAHRVYVVLIQSMLKLAGYRQEAIEPLVDAALQKFSHHPEVLRSQALYQQKFGYYAQALATLQQSLAANERYNDISLANEFLIAISGVYREMAELYDMMGNSVKALEHYVLAVKAKKSDEKAFDGLLALVRPQKAADIVWLINSLYDLHTEADGEFLVNRLAAGREKQVFAYYEKILSERFQRKEFTGMKFLLSGHYSQAIPLFAAAWRDGDPKAELMVVLATLLGDNPQAADLPGLRLDPAYQRIMTAYFRPKIENFLPPADFVRYLEVVDNSLHIADEGQLRRLLAVGLSCAVDDGPARIAALLAKQKLYRLAVELYVKQIERSWSRAAGELYCRAGFCCYKLKDYEAAAALFAAALEAGFTGNELGEYLAWTYRQCNDDRLRDKIRALQADRPQAEAILGKPACL